MIDEYPKRCNLCGGTVEFVSNDQIYGKKYGSGYAYLCLKCGAYVGTHKPHPKKALGLLANPEMRRLKMECHSLFDPLWKGKKQATWKRDKAYAWLAKELNIPLAECHFGWFDKPILLKAKRILETNQLLYGECVKK